MQKGTVFLPVWDLHSAAAQAPVAGEYVGEALWNVAVSISK